MSVVSTALLGCSIPIDDDVTRRKLLIGSASPARYGPNLIARTVLSTVLPVGIVTAILGD